MTREDAIKIVNELQDTYIKCRGEEDTIEVLIDSVDIEALDMAIKALEQIPKLQNRCHALTHGLLCIFCPYECEHRAEIEPQESEAYKMDRGKTDGK